MRHALTTLVLILVVAGFVRGWFLLTGTEKVPESNKVDVNIRVDPDKIKEDAEELKEEVDELENKFKDRSNEGTAEPDRDGERTP